ncbi:MAG: lipoyl(octanoyl) transferase LipB [Agromyces sp.]
MWAVENLGVGTEFHAYLPMWERQRAIHHEVVAGTRPDTLLLLEHEPVYTAGKRTEDSERPTDGTPVVDVDRGGKITWHGPGQLVGYPIVRLPDPIDVVAHVRRLEDLLIETIATFGVTGRRVDGRSGVWVGPAGFENKIAAIGIRVADGVTMHGFALNCSNSLEAYGSIIACGIRDAGVTTLSQETGLSIHPSDVVPVLEQLLIQHEGIAA